MTETCDDSLDETKRAILTRLEDLDASADVPVFTTSAVAEALPHADQTVSSHLVELDAGDHVASKKVGSEYGTRVWWLPEDTTSPEDGTTPPDDPIDYDDLDPAVVPVETAVAIAEAQVPGFAQRTAWTRVRDGGYAVLIVGVVAALLAQASSLGMFDVSTSAVETAMLVASGVGGLGLLLVLAGYLGAVLGEHRNSPAEPSAGEDCG